MGNLFKAPKAPKVEPPPVVDTEKQQEEKQEKARVIRTRALQETNALQGQFVRRTGLRL